MKQLLLILGMLSIPFLTFSQNSGKIICPQPDDTVTNGELLIVYRFADTLTLKPSSVKITIDLKKYNHLQKLKGNKLSLLVLEHLPLGYKIVRIQAKDKNNNIIKDKWGFYIKAKPQKKISKNKSSQKHLFLNADIETYSKLSDVSGNGASLRQEPPSTQSLRFNANIRIKNTLIPVKLYITNYEDKNLQTRNRFFTGIKGKKAGILIGDVHPNLQHLVIEGTRVRGIETYINFKWVRLNIVYGTIKRNIEGILHYYNSLDNPNYAPVNLQVIPNKKDSVVMIQGYYTDSGTYRRNYLSGRLSFGTQKHSTRFNVTFARATDDTNSISYGGQAAQNIVLGMSFETKTENNKFKLNMGLSSALTTRDIRNGVATREDFYNFYRMHLAFEPNTFRNIIVINTTTDLTTKHIPFLSWYIHPQFYIANQNISIKIQRIGSNYYSFGSPYLIKDRISTIITDRLHCLKNHLFANLYYRYFADNLSGINIFTNYSTVVNTSFNVLINKHLPRITGGYNAFYRKTLIKDTSAVSNISNISGFNIGINHSFKFISNNTSVFISYSYNSRKNTYNTTPLVTHLINTGLSQDYPFGLFFSFRYNFLLLTNDKTDFHKNNTYYFRLGYNTKNRKFKIYSEIRRIYFAETMFFPESNRNGVNIQINYMPFKNFYVSLKGGKSIYENKNNVNHNYNELFGLLQLKYHFSNKSSK